MKRFAFLALLVSVSFASANSLFYGGDHDQIEALSSELNTQIDDSMTYDNFQVTGDGWRVDTFYGHFLTTLDGIQTLQWEVRRNVSSGNVGELVASGQGDAISNGTGQAWFGLTEYKAEVLTGGLTLSAGTYWLGLRAVGDGAGRAYLATTEGANSVGGPINDGNAFFDSRWFGFDMAPVVDVIGDDYDFSVGATGAPVPEPATMLALGGAVAALARRRRRA